MTQVLFVHEYLMHSSTLNSKYSVFMVLIVIISSWNYKPGGFMNNIIGHNDCY